MKKCSLLKPQKPSEGGSQNVRYLRHEVGRKERPRHPRPKGTKNAPPHPPQAHDLRKGHQDSFPRRASNNASPPKATNITPPHKKKNRKTLKKHTRKTSKNDPPSILNISGRVRRQWVGYNAILRRAICDYGVVTMRFYGARLRPRGAYNMISGRAGETMGWLTYGRCTTRMPP